MSEFLTATSSQVSTHCAGVPVPRHADPILVCLDCGTEFRWSSSVDEDRCDHCATRHAVYLGRESA